MTATNYTVVAQADGSHPETVATYTTREDALARIEAMGGIMDEPVTISSPDREPETVYNLGRHDGCPIAWIEED